MLVFVKPVQAVYTILRLYHCLDPSEAIPNECLCSLNVIHIIGLRTTYYTTQTFLSCIGQTGFV